MEVPEYEEVRVVRVINPYMFWFVPESIEGRPAVKSIEHHLMETVCNRGLNLGYDPKLNEHVIYKNDHSQHGFVRAQVVQILKKLTDEIEYVLFETDYASIKVCTREELIPLKQELEHIPSDLKLAGLHGIAPLARAYSFDTHASTYKLSHAWAGGAVKLLEELLQSAVCVSFVPKETIDGCIYGVMKVTKANGKTVFAHEELIRVKQALTINVFESHLALRTRTNIWQDNNGHLAVSPIWSGFRREEDWNVDNLSDDSNFPDGDLILTDI